MPSSLPSFPAETPAQTTSARLTLTALHAALSRISNVNADPSLRPLIAESLARCAQLAQYFDRHLAHASGNPGIVDAQVFERLMLLAGPETARELLDQLLADLGTAQTALAAALPLHDWPALRAQCHVLIAVAGSIGAGPVQHEAERLQAASQQRDTAESATLGPMLLSHLAALIGFVEREQQSRAIA